MSSAVKKNKIKFTQMGSSVYFATYHMLLSTLHQLTLSTLKEKEGILRIIKLNSNLVMLHVSEDTVLKL